MNGTAVYAVLFAWVFIAGVILIFCVSGGRDMMKFWKGEKSEIGSYFLRGAARLAMGSGMLIYLVLRMLG